MNFFRGKNEEKSCATPSSAVAEIINFFLKCLTDVAQLEILLWKRRRFIRGGSAWKTHFPYQALKARLLVQRIELGFASQPRHLHFMTVIGLLQPV